MARLTKESSITVLNKERSVKKLLETLIYYPADEVTKFFNEINLSFPRSVRIDALKKVLRDRVIETRAERVTLADEMNYRLSWFNQYTETQLVNLLKFYKDSKLNKLALEEIWVGLINHMIEKQINENDFNHLIEASITHAEKTGLVLPDVIKYNDAINVLFFDEPNQIDGLSLEAIRPVLFKSSTLMEIRELGKKYGVNVPKRLKKSELIAILVQELKDRNEYSEEIEKELNKMSVILIQRFAKDNDIKVSTELKKEEIIEYVLANAEETKETYYVPSATVYEQEAEDIGEAIQEKAAPIEEDLVEETIIKEVIEEVEEELIEETVEIEPLFVAKVSGKNIKENRKIVANANKGEIIEGDDLTPVKHTNGWLKLLKALLIIIIVIIILIAVYGLIRPVGGFSAGTLAQIDDFLVKITFGLLDKLTNLVRG